MTDTVDIAVAVAFIEQTHPGNVGFAALAAIPAGGGSVTTAFFNLQRPDQWPDRAAQFLTRRVADHDLYLAVATFAEATRRTEDNALGLGCLYAEEDDHPLRPGTPPPTWRVQTSPGRYQSRWQLRTPLSVQAAKRALVALADYHGLGHQAVDVPRLLRLPGTINHKPGRGGFVVGVEDYRPEAVYDIEDFAAVLAAAPPPEERRRAGDNDAPIPEGERRTVLLQLAGAMRRHGADADTIAPALHGLNERRCAPPLAADEVDGLARDIATRYAPQHDAVRVHKGDAGTGPESGAGGEADTGGDERGGKQSQATLLVQLAADLELFNTPEGEAYAAIPVNGHREVWPLRVKQVRHLLTRRFYEEHSKAPGAQGLQDALGVLTARALFDGETHPVSVRIAAHEGAIYLDLGNAAWEAVRVDVTGWAVVPATECPVRFRRPKGALPLPTPVPGGTLALLRPYVNAADERTWLFVCAWLLASLRARGPYWVLAVAGEQGSAKSTLLRILRALIDPCVAPIRRFPRDARDLMISATHSLVLAFDNVSGLSDQTADDLCRLATGGGLSTRTLYADDEETLFDATRPIALNGIADLLERDDLSDRALPVLLERIPEEARQAEAALWAAFEHDRAAILGALLDAVSTALRNLPTTHLDRLPRMADPALWVVAAAPALGWTPGAFMAAYSESRAATAIAALDDSPLARAVLTLLEEHPAWRGSASALLEALNVGRGEAERKAEGWPKRPNTLSGTLRRLAPSLRAANADVQFLELHGKRIITLEYRGERSAPSALKSEKASDTGGKVGADARNTIGTRPEKIGTHPREIGTQSERAHENVPEGIGTLGADGTDVDNRDRHPPFPSADGGKRRAGAEGADLPTLHSSGSDARMILRGWANDVIGEWTNDIPHNVQHAAKHCGLTLDSFNVQGEAGRVLAYLGDGGTA